MSTRTYYLGFNGRVSQRKQLVGEVHATCRASNTQMALGIFDASAAVLGLLPGCTPHIGETTTEKLDRIVLRNTGFCTFHGLLNAKGSYRPTIRVDNKDMRFLADHYDQHMERVGDPRRAYRVGGAK